MTQVINATTMQDAYQQVNVALGKFNEHGSTLKSAQPERRYTATAIPTTVAGQITNQPERSLEAVNPIHEDGTLTKNIKNLDPGLKENVVGKIRERSASIVSENGRKEVNQNEVVETELTSQEMEQFNQVVKTVKDQINQQNYISTATDNDALKEIAHATIHQTMQSDSQQAQQLATFQRFLEYIDKVNQSKEGKELLANWDKGNKYTHYICQGKPPGNNDLTRGKAAESPAQAINLVMENVARELEENGKLSTQTMRDISALTTVVARQFRPQTNALAQLDNMVNLANALEISGGNSVAFNALEAHLKDSEYNDLGSLMKAALQQKESNGVLTEQLRKDIQAAFDVLVKHDSFNENDASTFRYPKLAAQSWDDNRIKPMPKDFFHNINNMVGLESLVKNKNADYSQVLKAEQKEGVTFLQNAEFPKSGFGPSLTTWYTTMFLDAVLNVSDSQKKVYAAGQASDWAANASAMNGTKYGNKISGGAHGISEPFLTYALSAGGNVTENLLVSEDSAKQLQDYMRATLARTALKMNIEIQNADTKNWQIVMTPKTKDTE